MKKYIMRFALASLILMAGAGLVFAGGGGEPKADPNAPIELKLVAWDVANTTYLKPMVDAYIAKHPNTKISYIDIPPNEYDDKLAVMLAGGDNADLVSVKDIPSYSGMVNRKQLEPLTASLQRDKIDPSKYAGANDITVNGQLYALPFRSDYWILYYNKDLFKKAGVALPTNDMTWAQYADLAKKMSSGTGTDRVYGTHYHLWRSTVELPTVQDGKNSIIQKDYSFMKPFYDMVIQMQNDKTVMDFASLKVGNIHYSGVFYNNKIAMLPMGTWFISTVISKHKTGEMTADWGIVKYPHAAGIKAGTTAGTITSLAVNAKSKNKAAAWDFLKFFAGPEGAAILAQTGNFPAISNDNITKVLSSREGFPSDANSAAALQTEKVRLELPLNDKASAVDRILNEEHELIMSGSVTVDQGLAEMSRRVTEALDQKQ